MSERVSREKKYVFRWKDGDIEVANTWGYDQESAWTNAVAMCRPVSMKGQPEAEVERFLRENGVVVSLETT